MRRASPTVAEMLCCGDCAVLQLIGWMFRQVIDLAYGGKIVHVPEYPPTSKTLVSIDGRRVSTNNWKRLARHLLKMTL